MDDVIKKYMSALGKKSWEKRKKKHTPEYMKELSKKAVAARKRNKKGK